MDKDIKLVAIDLDGTLLATDKKIVEKNIEAIKKIHEKGIEVVIATGRCFNGFWWIRQKLGLEGFDDYSICNTGAFVRRNADGKAIIENPMEKSDYEKISSYLGEYDLQIGIFTKDVLYNNAEVVNDGFRKDQEIMKLPRLKFKDYDDIEGKVARINFMGDEDKLDRFYEENKEAFKQPKSADASHILVEEEDKAREIYEKIQKGEDFEELAKEFSTCPSKEKGGNLGTFTKGQMVKEFEDAVFGNEVGTITEPVKTQFGYHIIKINEKNDAKELAFDEVKDKIVEQVRRQKEQELYNEKITELKDKYEVKMNI